MSDPHDASASDAHAGAHAFDPEPATDLSADEPRTPSWVPLLGACLFLVGAVYVLARPGGPDAPGAAASGAAPAASAAAQGAPVPAGSARPMPPQTREGRKELLEEIKRKRDAAGSGSAVLPKVPAAPPSSAAPRATAAPGPKPSAAAPPPAKPSAGRP